MNNSIIIKTFFCVLLKYFQILHFVKVSNFQIKIILDNSNYFNKIENYAAKKFNIYF